MPIFEYKCQTCGHGQCEMHSAFQKPAFKCELCGARVDKIFSVPTILIPRLLRACNTAERDELEMIHNTEPCDMYGGLSAAQAAAKGLCEETKGRKWRGTATKKTKKKRLPTAGRLN